MPLTPTTSNQALMADAYKIWKRGDPLSSDHIKAASSRELETYLAFIRELGPEFHLMWKELWLFHLDMERIRDARARMKRNPCASV